VCAVIVLRLALWMAPPVNYLLAMSSVTFRDYALGSAIGLAPPVVAIALFFDWFLPFLESHGWLEGEQPSPSPGSP